MFPGLGDAKDKSAPMAELVDIEMACTAARSSRSSSATASGGGAGQPLARRISALDTAWRSPARPPATRV
jgi:hypothetical protein